MMLLKWSSLIKAALFLGIFLLGLRWMSAAVARSSAPAFKKMLSRLTGSPWRGFGTGFLSTALVQSSSLITVMVVSLVNAGVMTLQQGFGVIVGANVGTTITGQLLSFNIYWLAWPLMGLAALSMFIPHRRFRKMTAPLLGCALLFLGMSGMTAALASLKESALFIEALQMARASPWRGIFTGAVAATALQSSSAVVGIVMGLAHEGMINLPAGVALLIGADVGTCTTALIASIGMDFTARRAAWFHFFFNLISLVLALLFYPSLLLIAAKSGSILTRRLANAHFIYNFLGAIVLLPLAEPLARLIEGGTFRNPFRRRC